MRMRRCEDEKMSVTMRICFTEHHYWKNPALRCFREIFENSNNLDSDFFGFSHDI